LGHDLEAGTGEYDCYVLHFVGCNESIRLTLVMHYFFLILNHFL